jgi:large subunit ribosomal protein L10
VQLEEKKNIVGDLREKFLRAKVVIVTDYKGLDVTSLNDLRKELRNARTEYRVVKNTLLMRASEDTDVALIHDSFKGPSAIALSYDDPVAPARVLTQFAKEHQKPEIKIGVLNGKVLDLTAIKDLSALPSREVLLAKALSVMKGVPTSFVRVLNCIPISMLNLLQAIKTQKESNTDE